MPLPENFVIKGDLKLSAMSLGALPDLSDAVVEGNFDCSFNQLTSLSGAPQKVGGTLSVVGISLSVCRVLPNRWVEILIVVFAKC